MDQKIIECPHCLNEVKHGANICTGCRAEIRYGLSIKAFFGYYFLTLVAILILVQGVFYLIEAYGANFGLDIEKINDAGKGGTPTLIFFGAILGSSILLYIFIFIKYIRKKYRNHISFRRIEIKY